MVPHALPRPDVLIAGAGVIGLSLALELHSRGAQVIVLERDTAMSHASTAAAGMLAADDPHNPTALHPFATFSISLYANYLRNISECSGQEVRFQTQTTLQEDFCLPRPLRNKVTLQQLGALLPGHVLADLHAGVLAEQSIDPRELAPALLAAVRASRITVQEKTELYEVSAQENGVFSKTSRGELHAAAFVDCRGAWSGAPVVPRKGQMLYLQPRDGFQLPFVLRMKDIYLLPRTSGPNAGRILVGATIEDAGFDTFVHDSDIRLLRDRAVALLPQLKGAWVVESWAGLRPGTPDDLPVIGRVGAKNCFVASGHYRNGILLAPGTAAVVADALEGKTPAVDLAPFDPSRFHTT